MTRRPHGRGAGGSGPPHLILIERRAVREPIVIETEPAGRRPRPTGFWRGSVFYRIIRVLERRLERGEAYLRVLADRGCYDLHRISEMDPWTWKTAGRWELVAELSALPTRRPLS